MTRPAGVLLLRHVPDFLDASGIDLRILGLVEIEFLDELFGQRTARAFGKNGDFRANIDSRFEVALSVAVLVDAFVAGSNADDLIVLR